MYASSKSCFFLSFYTHYNNCNLGSHGNRRWAGFTGSLKQKGVGEIQQIDVILPHFVPRLLHFFLSLGRFCLNNVRKRERWCSLVDQSADELLTPSHDAYWQVWVKTKACSHCASTVSSRSFIFQILIFVKLGTWIFKHYPHTYSCDTYWQMWVKAKACLHCATRGYLTSRTFIVKILIFMKIGTILDPSIIFTPSLDGYWQVCV